MAGGGVTSGLLDCAGSCGEGVRVEFVLGLDSLALSLD